MLPLLLICFLFPYFPSKWYCNYVNQLFTPQPSGLEGHCRHGPGGRADGCQTCGTHISVTAWWIFSIRSSVELSRPVVVHRHGHLPHMGLPMGQKLVKSGSTWARLWLTHISETPGWICTIRSSMELSRPVVVQHHGHLTLTLDFQGQILKILYLRNGRADWHGTKGMWIDRMLDPHCDFELWPHPWPLTLDFQGQIFKVVTQEWDARLTWNERDVSQ